MSRELSVAVRCGVQYVLLRTESNEIPHSERGTTSLYESSEELTTLGETDCVELARRIEERRGDFVEGKKLVADSINLFISIAEECRPRVG